MYEIRRTQNFRSLANIIRASILVGGLFAIAYLFTKAPQANAENSNQAIEAAMFTREEFFGSEAIVPLRTVMARDNLVKLAETSPNDPEILNRLAGVQEKLMDFDSAEKTLIRLVGIYPKHSEDLVQFYDRRARYSDEAHVLRTMLLKADSADRPAIFSRIIYLARLHDLKDYERTEFYREVAHQNTDVFPVFESIIDQLTKDEEPAEALKFLKEAETLFPERKSSLRDHEVSLLNDLGKGKEAERVYIASFDPFWTDEETEKFYSFLSEHDTLREYGTEQKYKFEHDNADFDTAIRLAHYRSYRSEEIAPIFRKLEKAKKTWSTDELVTAVRFLLREGESDLASRFLYTLYNRPELKQRGEMRAKTLYQLFEMFLDAQDRKLPLSTGDLDFFRRAATIDTDPGIATGILSLVFSDTDPGGQLDEKGDLANKYFNQAAAFKVFLTYKEENPTSPELGQMYLDIIRLYTASGDVEIAEKTLNEFAARYKDSTDFPQVALKLADAYVTTGDTEKSRQIYREVLDRIGDPDADAFYGSVDTRASDDRADYLAGKKANVTYGEVLNLLVASLAKEKKVPEILELYSREIKKYPKAEWLYEQRLSWLEQTNLTEEQLSAYREALERFQSNTWSDKLARWFLRQKRQSDFEDLSADLVGKLGDDEITHYLSEFIDSKVSASDFEKKLYLKLYLTAHSRFPHNQAFVQGLLNFYKANKLESEWSKLAAEYFFESPDVRRMYLDDLSEKGELRTYLDRANADSSIYKLFRADASVRLSEYENAVNTFKDLNTLYPNSVEFSEPLITLTRSFGQKDREVLSGAADLAHSQAEFSRSSAPDRTRSGELYAELGRYDLARKEWDKLTDIASGSEASYLDTATVYWDYFQYGDALRVISAMRAKFGNETLCSSESGAIHESLHDTTGAIEEYVKALDAEKDEEQKAKATRRLVTLSHRKGNMSQIESAFTTESGRRKDPSYLTLGYAEFLTEIKDPEEAEKLLDRSVRTSKDNDFLEAARDFYADQGIDNGERAALMRLSQTTESPRRKIKYELELARSFEEHHDQNSSRTVLAQLVNQFPRNYGVVTSASDLYHQLGLDDESVNVLRSALANSRGQYKTVIAGKLSHHLIQLDRLDAAEQILTNLHEQNKTDLDLFRDLAGIYVRKNEPEALRNAFNETVSALKASNADRREIDDEIAGFRTQMIDAFTRLKDYHSAVEQHIEIINRDADDEALTENAIAYAKRYGGADALLAYYQKTSNEAFKNYRWNVVLAKIYEANGDLVNAIRNYRSAIDNQPEMEELYLAVSDLEVRQGNFEAAIGDVDKVLELTNDAPQYIRKKIEILKKAGRNSEAKALQGKLPTEEKPKIKTDPFAEAAKMQGVENKEEARRLYREAFNGLDNDPLSGELTSVGITGYVRSIREEEPLQKISERLWSLREKLIYLADENSSTKAGEARRRLSVLEGAFTESFGNILRTTATDDEFRSVHDDLRKRILETHLNADAHGTLSLIQDLSHRAGFGELEEQILLKKLTEGDAAFRQSRSHDLVNFYNQRGAFEKGYAVLEQYKSDDQRFNAEEARLAGYNDKELDALRAIYWKPSDKPAADKDPVVERFLTIVYAANKDELKSLTARNSAYQFQLINFLLGKGEKALAHAAIDTANLSQAWRVSRNAEASLALREFGTEAVCYFCDALQFDSIGGMIEQAPDKQRFLVGEDWFRLSREYGEWLYRLPQKSDRSSLYLIALTEERPRSSADQADLGAFYLESKNTGAAVEHFRIAVEESPNDIDALAGLGAAYYIAGRKDWANEMFQRAVTGANPKDLGEFFDTLGEFGLSAEGRNALSPQIVMYLEDHNVDNSEDFQNLVRSVADSFKDEKEKTDYFLNILKKRPSDTSLAKMLLDESLIDPSNSDPFFERIVSESEPLRDYESDYDFKAILGRTWAADDAESVFDQGNDYKMDEPDNIRLKWEQKYLDSLFARHRDAQAAGLIARTEHELRGKYPRPEWLRLGKLKLGLRSGKFDQKDAERFIGITAADPVTDVKPPSIERFNSVLQMFRDEGAETYSLSLSESFFSRNLALEQYQNANFVGLARVFAKQGNTGLAIRLLQLMVNAASDESRPTAIAEISDLPGVKLRQAARSDDIAAEDHSSLTETLALAAVTAIDFGKQDAAIAFRRELKEAAPADISNLLELSRLLSAGGDKKAGGVLLMQIINDPNATRSERWLAKWQMRQADASFDMSGAEFDPLAQFYNGLLDVNSNQKAAANTAFVNALIAGDENDTTGRLELIRLYAANGREFAALRLAESNALQKPDDLLRILSECAERTGDMARAIQFEKQKSDGGDTERIAKLQQLSESADRRATDLMVDAANTRKL